MESSKLSALFKATLCAALAYCGAACGGTATEVRPAPDTLPGLNPDEHMLLNPVGTPQSLLGRAVTEGPDGALVIADELAPGCKVTVREEAATGTHESRQEVGHVAVLSAGLPAIGDLKARYGDSVSAYVRIRNTKNLVADIEGPCGKLVVTKVKVGVGKREFQHLTDAGAEGGATVSGVGVGGETRSWRSVGQALTWDSEQAWAFRATRLDGLEAIGLQLEMPAELLDGDEYSIQVTTKREVWLVVLWVEEDNTTGLLLPNSDHPTIVVPVGQKRPLPKMRVGLREPSEPARERIVVYAFTNPEDYKDFKPPVGFVSEPEAEQYLEQLQFRLESIPRRRWDRAEVRYLIKAKGEPTPSGQ